LLSLDHSVCRNAALAAIIFIAFKSIVKQLSEVKRLWALSKGDCFVWMVTFIGTLGFGVKIGIVGGVLSSLLCMLQSSLRPYHAMLGRLPNTEVYRDVRRYPDAAQSANVITWRFDGPIVFANREYFKAQLLQCVAEASNQEQLGDESHGPPLDTARMQVDRAHQAELATSELLMPEVHTVQYIVAVTIQPLVSPNCTTDHCSSAHTGPC
jgi:MFS superfamily sulfate permease-like transporter